MLEIVDLDTMPNTELVHELSQIVATTVPKKHQKGIWATLYKKIQPSSPEEEEEEEEEVDLKVHLYHRVLPTLYIGITVFPLYIWKNTSYLATMSQQKKL